MSTRKIHLGMKTANPAYGSWRAMKSRCLYEGHPHYENYGGRGITVDPAWLDFDVFFSDMGERPANHTLERLDNEAGYCAVNCVWADWKTQNRNRSNTTMLNFNGKLRPLVECSEITGTPVSTIEYRLKTGWSVFSAVTEPLMYKSPREEITFRGVSKTVSDWEKDLDFGSRVVYQRIYKLGWSVEKALTTPVKGKGGYNG